MITLSFPAILSFPLHGRSCTCHKGRYESSLSYLRLFCDIMVSISRLHKCAGDLFPYSPWDISRHILHPGLLDIKVPHSNNGSTALAEVCVAHILSKRKVHKLHGQEAVDPPLIRQGDLLFRLSKHMKWDSDTRNLFVRISDHLHSVEL